MGLYKLTKKIKNAAKDSSFYIINSAAKYTISSTIKYTVQCALWSLSIYLGPVNILTLLGPNLSTLGFLAYNSGFIEMLISNKIQTLLLEGPNNSIENNYKDDDDKFIVI